jgi:hypothetical protein
MQVQQSQLCEQSQDQNSAQQKFFFSVTDCCIIVPVRHNLQLMKCIFKTIRSNSKITVHRNLVKSLATAINANSALVLVDHTESLDFFSLNC